MSMSCASTRIDGLRLRRSRHRRDCRHRGRAGAASGPEGPHARVASHERVQPLRLGAQQPLAHRLSDDRCGARRASCRISGSAAPRILPSSSRRWSCRPAGPARPSSETLNQVTERLERTLQETPKLDFLRSFTRPGVTTIFVNLKGSATAKEVPDIWYHVRKSIGDMRQYACRPASSGRASTTSSATLSASSTDSPRTASPIASCATMSRSIRSEAAECPRCLEDRDPRRAGRADLRRVLDAGACNARHRPFRAGRRAAGAEYRSAGRHNPDRN